MVSLKHAVRLYYLIKPGSESQFFICNTLRTMEQQNLKQRFAIRLCVKLGESETLTYEKWQRAYEERFYIAKQRSFLRIAHVQREAAA